MPDCCQSDVMMAKREDFGGRVGGKRRITPANLSILKQGQGDPVFNPGSDLAARWTASRRIFWNIENLKKHTERSIGQMHMEPNHEGAASVPQTTGAPILPAERVYQDLLAPAGLKDKNRTVDSLHGVDACFAILALVCGYLFVWLVNPLALLAPYSLGVGVTIFAACFYTTALLYMRKQKISPPKSSYGWLGLSMVSALYFALFSNGVLKFFNLFFCMIVTVYWIAAACGSPAGTSSVGLLCWTCWINCFGFLPILLAAQDFARCRAKAAGAKMRWRLSWAFWWRSPSSWLWGRC